MLFRIYDNCIEVYNNRCYVLKKTMNETSEMVYQNNTGCIKIKLLMSKIIKLLMSEIINLNIVCIKNNKPGYRVFNCYKTRCMVYQKQQHNVNPKQCN